MPDFATNLETILTKVSTILLVLFSLFFALALTSCGKKSSSPAAPSDIVVDIPEDFDTADEIILDTDSANEVKKKIEAGAKYGVGLSNTAFSLLHSDVSDWQSRILGTPGEYTLDEVSGAGMSLSYVVMEGGYYDEEAGCYRISVSDLKDISKALFGEDYISGFLLRSSEFPGYDITVSSREITFALNGYSGMAPPESVTEDLVDNGDGTYGASAKLLTLDEDSGTWSNVAADITYTLAETDQNATGYMIKDWKMTVY